MEQPPSLPSAATDDAPNLPVSQVSQGKREALQDCQELAQRLEALLDDASSRRGARSSSKELMPQEVKDRGPVRRCGDGRCFVFEAK